MDNVKFMKYFSDNPNIKYKDKTIRMSLRFFIGGLIVLPFAIAMIFLSKMLGLVLAGFFVASLLFFYYRTKRELDKHLNADSLRHKEINLPCGWDGTKKFLSKWPEYFALATAFIIGYLFGYEFLMMLVLEGACGMLLGIGWYYLSVERKYDVKLKAYKYD